MSKKYGLEKLAGGMLIGSEEAKANGAKVSFFMTRCYTCSMICTL